MLKAKELRIGNFLNFPTEHLEKGTSKAIDIEAIDILSIERGTLKPTPIPLTEEWLLKFGFYHNKDVSLDKIFVLKLDERFCFSISLGYITIELEGAYGSSNGGCFETNTTFVHQLQNLYHALTGQELQIKQ